MANRSASDTYTRLANFFVGKSYFPLIFILFLVTLAASVYLSYIDFMTSVEGYRMTGFQMFGGYEMYAAGFVPQAWQVILGLSTMGILATGGDSHIGSFSIRTSYVLGFATALLFLVDIGTDVYFKVNGNFSDPLFVLAAVAVSFSFFTIGSEVMLVFSFSAVMAMWRAGGKSIGDVIELFIDGILDLVATIIRVVGNIIKRMLGVFVNKGDEKGPSIRPSADMPKPPMDVPGPPRNNLPIAGVGGGGSRTPQASSSRTPQAAGPQIRNAKDLEEMVRQQQQAQSQERGGRRKPPKRR